MTSVLFLLTVVIILVVIALVITLYLGFRAIRLYKTVGSFECHCLMGNSTKWENGIAKYDVYELTWYSLIGFDTLPELRWKRSLIKFDPQTIKYDELDPNKIIVEFVYRDFLFALYMDIKDYEGFISWLDSGLPETKHIY